MTDCKWCRYPVQQPYERFFCQRSCADWAREVGVDDEGRAQCRKCGDLTPKTGNPLELFCSPGCYRTFGRCLICSGPVAGKAKTCTKCKPQYAQLKKRKKLGKYATGTGSGRVVAGRVPEAQNSPMISTPKSSVLPPILTPKIKVIAGQISQAEMRAASIGIGDAFDLDRRLNPEMVPRIGPTDPPVNIIGGYRFPGARKISLT